MSLPAEIELLAPSSTAQARLSDAEIAARVDAHAGRVMASVARTFDLASRFLPADLRRDVRRLYLVLRTLDDLVDDGDEAAPVELARVAAWADGAAALGPLASILDDLALRYRALPRDAVADFCAGMRDDLAGPDLGTELDLDVYCYRVAGTVGRLMASLLGVEPGGSVAADLGARRLGAAMQRTNILRDLVEDARAGRVYLPDEAFIRAGLDPRAKLELVRDLPRLDRATRMALLSVDMERADADYEQGLAAARLLARGRRSIVAAGILYREILRQIEREGFAASDRRAVVPRGRKALLVLRAVLLPA
jgi:phytoene synthase